MARVPHFALPFRYEGGAPVVNDQDGPDDVEACVEAVLRTPPGQRPEYPEFGAPDLTFTQLPRDTSAIATAVSRFEPRVRALAETDPERFAEAVARISLSLTQEV